jgi:hypothetical protein
MKKKTRLIILLFCIVCFFVIAPILVAYSMGYRIDFETIKIVGTGGIYVRTFPSADEIVIDFKISARPGLFSNAVFVQSLLPKEHTVYIQKNGYFDYFKTLPVQEKEVTKLENIILFKKKLAFNQIIKEVDYFSIAPDNQKVISASSSAKSIDFNYFHLNSTNATTIVPLPASGKILSIDWSNDSNVALIKLQIPNNINYYFFEINGKEIPKINKISLLDKTTEKILFNPQNPKELFYIKNNVLYIVSEDSPEIIAENVLTYQVHGNNIFWLSQAGEIIKSNLSGKQTEILIENKFNFDKSKTYQIIPALGKIFLRENNSLMLLNQSSKILENFKAPDFEYEILNSPDNKKIIYWDKKQIYIYNSEEKKSPINVENIFFGENISNIQWLNNDYIIFTNVDDIVISEIDYRGEINSVVLPKIIELNEKETLKISNPKTFFVQQTGKLYILTEKILLESEKLVP